MPAKLNKWTEAKEKERNVREGGKAFVSNSFDLLHVKIRHLLCHRHHHRIHLWPPNRWPRRTTVWIDEKFEKVILPSRV